MRKRIFIAAAVVIIGVVFLFFRSPEPRLKFAFVRYAGDYARFHATNETSQDLSWDDPTVQIKTASGWTNYISTPRYLDELLDEDMKQVVDSGEDAEFSVKLPEGHFIWRAKTSYARFTSPFKVRANQWAEKLGLKPVFKPTWYSTTTAGLTR